MFATALFTSTEGPRGSLSATETPFGTWWIALVQVLVAYTLFNVFWLAWIASFLGLLAGQLRLGDVEKPLGHYLASASVQAIYVYFILAGTLLLASDTMVEPTQAKYMNLALATSALSFMLSYTGKFAEYVGREPKPREQNR